MARIGAVEFSPVFRGFQNMASMKKLFLALISALLVTSASFALESQIDGLRPDGRGAGPRASGARR